MIEDYDCGAFDGMSNWQGKPKDSKNYSYTSLSIKKSHMI
jgi:hypothetical protein